ncbi:sigma-70 family RNA polymerase sigma factor [Planctomycetota bacterium]
MSGREIEARGKVGSRDKAREDGQRTGQLVRHQRQRFREDEELRRLWRAYRDQGGLDLRNRLLQEYLPVVQEIAERLKRRFPPNVDVEDLASMGTFGLLEAIESFDISRRVRFYAYSRERIRGAILDELRRGDHVPRSARDRVGRLERTLHSLQVELGHRPADHDVARMLNLSLSGFDKLVRESKALSVISLYEPVGGCDGDSTMLRRIDVLEDKRQLQPYQYAARIDTVGLLVRALSKQERSVLLLHYYDQLTLREIAVVLERSESHVNKLHTRIRNSLRQRLLGAGAAAMI